MPVWCPGWMPSPIDAIIHGQWNTARVAQHQWQLGYAWLEEGQLVHVVFEGYPPGTFPPNCEGVPCHSGHIAAVFKSGADVYVVSIHVASPVSTKAIAKRDLRHIISSSSVLKPS